MLSTPEIRFDIELEYCVEIARPTLTRFPVSSRWSSTITNEIQDSHRVNGNGWGVITKHFSVFFFFLID
jgi:hypothetical protein